MEVRVINLGDLWDLSALVPLCVPDALLLIGIPANAPKETAEDDPSVGASACPGETRMEFLAPGLTLAQPCGYVGSEPVKGRSLPLFPLCLNLSHCLLNIYLYLKEGNLPQK